MSYVRVLRNGQITVPKDLRESLGIKEGDILELEMEKNKVVIKPKMLVDKISELSTKGEEKLKEALELYKKGKAKEFDNIKDLIKDLSS